MRAWVSRAQWARWKLGKPGDGAGGGGCVFRLAASHTMGSSDRPISVTRSGLFLVTDRNLSRKPLKSKATRISVHQRAGCGLRPMKYRKHHRILRGRTLRPATFDFFERYRGQRVDLCNEIAPSHRQSLVVVKR